MSLINKELNEFKKGYSNSEINYKSNNNEINIKNILFNEIPKINIKGAIKKRSKN